MPRFSVLLALALLSPGPRRRTGGSAVRSYEARDWAAYLAHASRAHVLRPSKGRCLTRSPRLVRSPVTGPGRWKPRDALPARSVAAVHLRKILRVPRRTADAPLVLAFDRRTGAAAGRYEVRPDGAPHVVGDLTVTRGAG